MGIVVSKRNKISHVFDHCYSLQPAASPTQNRTKPPRIIVSNIAWSAPPSDDTIEPFYANAEASLPLSNGRIRNRRSDSLDSVQSSRRNLVRQPSVMALDGVCEARIERSDSIKSTMGTESVSLDYELDSESLASLCTNVLAEGVVVKTLELCNCEVYCRSTSTSQLETFDVQLEPEGLPICLEMGEVPPENCPEFPEIDGEEMKKPDFSGSSSSSEDRSGRLLVVKDMLEKNYRRYSPRPKLKTRSSVVAVASSGGSLPGNENQVVGPTEVLEDMAKRIENESTLGQPSTDLRIFRRANGKVNISKSCSKAASVDVLDSEETSPPGSQESLEIAAKRLHQVLRILDSGLELPIDKLKMNLRFAASVLDHAMAEDACKRLVEEEDELSEVQQNAVPPEVRAWLASTFTRQNSAASRKAGFEKPRFRSVANAIRAGIFVERIYRRMSSSSLAQFPADVTRILKQVDDWNFDVFSLSEASGGNPIRYLGIDLINRYGLNSKFKIPTSNLESFLGLVETGYCKYRNLYHNNVHAADVAQTVHYMLCQTGIQNLLSDLEIFAAIFAAIIHDFEHTGTTNGFHVASKSDVALIYNDRSVLENHHVSAAFRILREEENNICVNMTKEEFREFRSLVIEMVLATDMSGHFQQIKAAKASLGSLDQSFDKAKVLSLVLHVCDISHPSKPWHLHMKWTEFLLEEFFRQGDKEKELGLPFSPLCDRNTTPIAESQIGFIDFIVEPTMVVLEDTLNLILTFTGDKAETPGTEVPSKRMESESDTGQDKAKSPLKKPWRDHLSDNKQRWKERSEKDALIRMHKLETVISESQAEASEETETTASSASDWHSSAEPST